MEITGVPVTFEGRVVGLADLSAGGELKMQFKEDSEVLSVLRTHIREGEIHGFDFNYNFKSPFHPSPSLREQLLGNPIFISPPG